jgi:uncharacterized FAD-dependent dehydrogenase
MEEISFQCSPEEARNSEFISAKLKQEFVGEKDQKIYFILKKRSIDSRKRAIKINLNFLVSLEEFSESVNFNFDFKNITESESIHIIGAGPAGLFAALRALERGFKPIIFERGKDVRERRRDLAILNKEGRVNSESNYCFGEGGAGTYSDGKLYTRSKKRGDVERILQMLVYFGANEDILVEAHPHVGTNKLPQIITAIREKIIDCGGEIHFEHKLSDLTLKNQTISEIEINGNKKIKISNLVLATGHSARDIFELLHRKKIEVLAKPFAIGVRIEHTQELIDKIQYHGRLNDEYLPPASYNLVAQIEGKGVYSFCMCPGGIIAPCATENKEVVTNGWSPSKRNNPYSNSGIVVSIEPKDLKGDQNDPFICLNFQREIEEKCWELAGKNQKVPAQRLLDFIQKKKSVDFPKSSYQPGISSVEMDAIFPRFIVSRLRKGFIEFGKKMNGFITNEAVIHAPESRTSSPVLIPRNKETLQHIQISNLYPCAEGAGYAGGIISAAIDGMKSVDAIVEKHKN